MKTDGYEEQSSSSRSKDNEDFAEERSITSRERARSQLEREIEEFLAGGGAISEIDPEVTADPPRKPQPKYGSRPI
ncbi:hypothetical protein [Microbulbifer yueqingensis]|uniref:Transcriptional regulator SutA RNAP-binding domain-containing protein n=1 Tax=Microbulbifer yueqingensis TaxID=658219 RepID=A0A1G9EFA9_9GAMM|nr:hypothetical protein [Microbulbifer yueqingensis]SDK74763.1 hypothetical protein SAMN05216212_3098 [Microbulbifer yueqingensis]